MKMENKQLRLHNIYSISTIVAALCSALAGALDHSRPCHYKLVKFACVKRVSLTQFGKIAHLCCAVMMYILSNSVKAISPQSVCYKLLSQECTPQTIITWLFSQH